MHVYLYSYTMHVKLLFIHIHEIIILVAKNLELHSSSPSDAQG